MSFVSVEKYLCFSASNRDDVERRFEGKLSKNMSGSLYEMVSRVMKALVNRKITVPGNFQGFVHTCTHTQSQSKVCPFEFDCSNSSLADTQGRSASRVPTKHPQDSCTPWRGVSSMSTSPRCTCASRRSPVSTSLEEPRRRVPLTLRSRQSRETSTRSAASNGEDERH